MKAALVSIVVGTAVLIGALVLWQRGGGPVSPGSGSENVLRVFETAHPPLTIDLGKLYGGRLELLDPKRALPSWHRHPRAEAVRAFDATRRCAVKPEIEDVELKKAVDLQEASCRGGDRTSFAESAPFLHPSGRSYASLVRAADRAHLRSFHVLELASLDPSLLDESDRVLAAIEPAAWQSIEAGDRVVLGARHLVLVDRGAFGPTRLRVHRRGDWDAFIANGPLILAPRGSSWCTEDASSSLCWRTVPVTPRDRLVVKVLSSIGVLCILLGAASLAIALVRSRHAAELERAFLLRALTHELRTPATTLKLDVEPLRSSFDELPENCQEPMLRVFDGVDRLTRVIEVTGRALALLDEKKKSTLEPERISYRAWLEEIAEGWPEGVELSIEGDGDVMIDPDWGAVALRNLVENAVRHGKAPVRVSATKTAAELVVRVSDAGETPNLSLSEAVVQSKRGKQSSGLGLGLALAHRIAFLSKGSLRHEPVPTTFVLTIPLGRNDA